ncbi:fibrinogen-like protein 1 [Mytilus californianus]|uniref:fibrinogen-like protein 1 n=1 Tax=Mytilus californianus TaxID=6549 RepID=UPI002246F5B2|nr:fibrinogen-like protein 1 [Mytilus californianus]
MFLTFIIYGAVVINSICHGISQIKNKRIFKTEAGQRIVSSLFTITTTTVSSTACASLCTSDNDCKTASYDDITKQCKLDSDCNPTTENWQNGILIRLSNIPADCSGFPEGTIDGVYTISVNNDCIYVYCDMVDKWTVIQRRQDGSTDFYRDWSDYKNGFGNLSGEYWLGNDNIFSILNGKSYSLRFDLEDWSGEWRYAQYEMFSIADESADYELTLAGYSGDAGDSMLDSYQPLNLNGQRFSTKDRDNDNDPNGHCALTQKGGWWYKWCTYANPNGLYFLGNEPGHSGIYWYLWNNSIPFYPMKSVTMKIKRLP